jgi:hypothetical protein
MADFLTEALKANVPKNHIADFLAEEQNFNIEEARRQGVPDDRIIAYLLGTSASSAFGSQFMQGFKSSAQGIGQMLGMSDREDIKAQREAADIMSSLNPVAGTTGSVVGNILDPIALPTAAVAPLRGATLATTLAKKGAAQGAFSGFLEPITKEEESTGVLSLNRVLNSIISAPIGAAIGGGAGALIQRLTRKPDVPEVAPKTAADEISDVLTGAPVKAADEAAPITRAADEAVPVERAITGEGIAPRIISDAETKAIETRIGQLSSEIDDLRWRQAEGAPKAEEPPVAALLKGEAPVVQREATDLPPVGRDTRGLVSPTRQEQQPQVASLFQRAQPEPVPPVVPRSPQQPALLKTNIEKTIQQKQEEITKLQERLAEKLRLEEARTKPELVQVETKKAVPAKEADIAPLTPAEQAKVAQLQQVLDKNGFKTVDEAVAATAKTAEERAAAQARIDAGQTQTLEQLVRGFRSGGSAAVPPERLFSDKIVMSSAPQAAVRATMGETKPLRGSRAEVTTNAEAEKLLQDVGGLLDSAELKAAREGGKYAGTLKGTIEAGIDVATKAAKEEGSFLAWLFKQDDNGDFINIDKSWNRGEIAAFMPIVRDASRIYNKLMAEAVDINMAGKLDDKALQDVMERMVYPIQIMGIFQAKRTQASRSLNAFKTLNAELKGNQTVSGFLNAGKTC